MNDTHRGTSKLCLLTDRNKIQKAGYYCTENKTSSKPQVSCLRHKPKSSKGLHPDQLVSTVSESGVCKTQE